jgi:S-adenosylmethionine:tRNA ribosyltransferase-isomerase
MFKLSDFDYELPDELIASNPPKNRGDSRLLVATNQNLLDLKFNQIIDFINPNDVIVFNNSKVIKARLFGNKISGGKIEILIERILPNKEIIAFIGSNKTIPIGMIVKLPNEISVKVIEKMDGLFKLSPISPVNWLEYLDKYGHIPLPPYIKRTDDKDDETRYQTVYAKNEGSVASPTAGLHFTKELLEQIKNKGATIAYVTLHVGSGTFKPVSNEDISKHKMHSEIYSIDENTLQLIRQARLNGGSIIAVGTTSVRTLETVAKNSFTRLTGETDIFITPGYKFQLVDKMITNFHLPKSTLMMLVSAFAGFETIKKVYSHAVKNKYRFFSYGDACIFMKQGEENE